MKHRFIARLLAGIFILFSFSFAQAQEQNLAQWYYAQDNWDNATLDELNFQASTAYKEITGSRFSVEELMARNEFHWFFPDFQAQNVGMDLSCIQATAQVHGEGGSINQYYLPYGIDYYFVSTIFHENLHSDVTSWSDLSGMAPIGREGIVADGFETNIIYPYDNIPVLRYFDEAYVSLLTTLIMQEAGFTDFNESGMYYQAGVEILEPAILDIMDRGATLRDLYDVHTRGDLETILVWLGMILIRPEESAPESLTQEEFEVAIGWSFANEVHFSVVEAMNIQAVAYVASVEPSPSPEPSDVPDEIIEMNPEPQTIFRATCGMDLWFTPEQYEQANNNYSFPSGVWRQNTWGNWVIEEEDYYAVIDRP